MDGFPEFVRGSLGNYRNGKVSRGIGLFFPAAGAEHQSGETDEEYS
jgi:hypothetical protein